MAVYEEEKYYGNRLVKHTVTIRNGYGDGSGGLKLINGYAPLKNESYASVNQDLKDVMKYFFGG